MNKLHAHFLLKLVESAKWEGILSGLVEEIKSFLIENGAEMSQEEVQKLLEEYKNEQRKR